MLHISPSSNVLYLTSFRAMAQGGGTPIRVNILFSEVKMVLWVMLCGSMAAS
jgi:hypothetical protein